MIRIVAFGFAALLTGSLPAAVPGAEALAKLITSQFDTNSDSLLDAGEWQAGVANGFAETDSNTDGELSGAEIDALTGRVAEETGELAATLVVALIKRGLLSLDTDGNGTVSRKEYAVLAEDVFKKLDANKNNSLDQEELLQLPTLILVR